MKKKIDLEEVRAFIENTSEDTKIYIGGDSTRYKRNGVWFARYCTVVIIHFEGKHGCKLFWDFSEERDYDQKKDKPRVRLMTEVMKTAQLYIDLEESIDIRDCEIHLDLNKDEKHGSNCVVKEAIGYVRGMCNVVPMIKPNAFAAATAADHLLKVG